MAVKLTTEKKKSLHEACNDLLLHKTQAIRRVAQVDRNDSVNFTRGRIWG